MTDERVEPRAATPSLHGAAVVVVVVLAAVPALRMLAKVLDGSPVPFADYWVMLPHFVESDGGTDLGGFFVFQNEHPVVIAKVLYWINLHLAAGSNITLGVMVVGIVVAQVVIVGLLVRRSGLPAVQQGTLVVLASTLLFGLAGSWNFLKAMSGAAWLTANLFALLAVYLRSRDLRVVAVGSAVLASVSYGTGIAVWPALLAVGVVRRAPRDWWREWPYATGFVATYLWYRSETRGSQISSPDLGELWHDVASLMGFPLGSHGDAATWIGAAVLLAAVGLAGLLVVRLRAEAAAPWLGLAAYGIAASFVITWGRSMAIGSQPVSRYHSLPAIACIGLAGLVLVLAQDPIRRLARPSGSADPRLVHAGAAAVLLVPLVFAWSTGGEVTEAIEAEKERQGLGAIAIRLGLDPEARSLLALGAYTGGLDRLRAAGQYPFSSRWDADCGLLGEPLDHSDDRAVAGGVRQMEVDQVLEDGLQLRGDIVDPREPRCVLITGDDEVVIGVGMIHTFAEAFRSPDDDSRRFIALAPTGHAAYRAFVVYDDDEPVPLDRTVPADQVT